MPLLIKYLPLKSIAFVGALGFIAYKYVYSKRRSLESDTCIVIESIDEWDMHESEIIDTFGEERFVGIDCEWVTQDNKRKPISILQLATQSGFCVLVRLSCLPIWAIPRALADLLQNELICKVGVAVDEDANKLFNDYGLQVCGFLDLRHLCKNFTEMEGKSLSLKSLANNFLGVHLDKSAKLRCSDWDATTLSAEQINYAASDAVSAAKIFFAMQKCSTKSRWFWGDNTHFLSEIDAYIDLPFKAGANEVSIKSTNRSALKVKYKKSKSTPPRKKPMYDNCQIIAPDGEILCGCDMKKANWYLNKGLAEKVSDNPFTVCLNFEPSGRPLLDNRFYTQEKTNQCVVCGALENFLCKSIVPSEYRKYFPDIMKKNLSHDVLLLCISCHKRSNNKDQLMYKKLAQLCNAPLICKSYFKYSSDPRMAKVRSAARALNKFHNRIPDDRKLELNEIITEYYNISTLTPEILEKACKLDANALNDSFVPHGLKVYQYFCENDGLIQLEKIWRQHFLDSMHPKYLPALWSIDHNHKRLALQILNKERIIDFDVSIIGLTPKIFKEVASMQK